VRYIEIVGVLVSSAATLAAWVAAVSAMRSAKAARSTVEVASRAATAAEQTAAAAERAEEQHCAEGMRELVKCQGVPELRTYLRTLPERFMARGQKLLARAIAAEGKGPHFLGQPAFTRSFPEAAQLLESGSAG